MLKHNIVFFDINKNNIETYQKILNNTKLNISFVNTTFKDLINNYKIIIIVSPSNSYLSMSGGIDLEYAKCFPGIEDKLRKIMIQKKYDIGNITYKGSKYFLPVGKSILCETGNIKCPIILSSPTMFTPKDIRGTNNIYKCMKSILDKLQLCQSPITIAIPCLGTGIGNMSAQESAKQILNAIEDI